MTKYTRQQIEKLGLVHDAPRVLEVNSAKPKKRRRNIEKQDVQVPSVAYFRDIIQPRYPQAVLIVNPHSDQNMSIQHAARMKKQGYTPGQADMLIIHPKHVLQTPAPKGIEDYSDCQAFTGIALELKAEGKGAYRKDWALKSGDHLRRQKNWMHHLSTQGYFCAFTEGLEQTIEYLAWYFNTPKL